MRRFPSFLALAVTLACLIVATSGGLSLGQTMTKGGKKGQLPAGWKALQLTPEQSAKVTKINVEYAAKIQVKQQEIADLRAEERKLQLAVLTNEQKMKLAGIEPPAGDGK